MSSIEYWLCDHQSGIHKKKERDNIFTGVAWLWWFQKDKKNQELQEAKMMFSDQY